DYATRFGARAAHLTKLFRPTPRTVRAAADACIGDCSFIVADTESCHACPLATESELIVQDSLLPRRLPSRWEPELHQRYAHAALINLRHRESSFFDHG